MPTVYACFAFNFALARSLLIAGQITFPALWLNRAGNLCFRSTETGYVLLQFHHRTHRMRKRTPGSRNFSFSLSLSSVKFRGRRVSR